MMNFLGSSDSTLVRTKSMLFSTFYHWVKLIYSFEQSPLKKFTGKTKVAYKAIVLNIRPFYFIKHWAIPFSNYMVGTSF